LFGLALADRCGGPMRDRDKDSRETDDRRTAALMGLAIVLSLAVAGVVLMRDLGKEAKLEDCLMSGRTNCAPIEIPQAR
jgi:hypothetical protein